MAISFAAKARGLSKHPEMFVFALVVLFCLYVAPNTIITGSDAGFEFRNAKVFLETGRLESGPVVQQLLYSIAFGMFGLDYHVLPILQAIFTSLLVFITYLFLKKKTTTAVASVACLFFLFFTYLFPFGIFSGKQYPMLMFLVVLSLYLFDDALNQENDNKLIFSAILMALAYMTHMLAITGLAIPFLYYVLSKIMRRTASLRQVTKFYVFAILALSPYLAWRIYNDGFLFYHYPNAWGTLKYGQLTNLQFWGEPARFTYEYFHQNWVIAKSHLLLPLVSLFFAIGTLRLRREPLLTAWLLSAFIPYIVSRAPTSYPYLYPFMPILVVISGIGLFSAIKRVHSKALKTMVILLIILLPILNINALVERSESLQAATSLVQEDAKLFQELIGKDENVLFRSYGLAPLIPSANIIHITKDIAEEDAVTYLGWASDEEVAEVMRKYDISYVILYKKAVFWEFRYNLWLKVATGAEPRHYLRIEDSPYFEKVVDGESFVLYKFVEEDDSS